MVATAVRPGLDPKMTKDTLQNQEFSVDDLFKLTMEKRWDQVVEIYRNHPKSHITRLTNSGETALHIAVSSYHSKHSNHAKQIKQMIEYIEISDYSFEVLSMRNVNGDAPLHLAAAVGWETICKCIASNRQLISLCNLLGETPLFIAAHHGKLQTFLCLHELYNQGDRTDESLCRRKDGNTILHSAISGEYFGLAYQIISYYPKLINSVNVEGESPLHVLARKPNVFKSSWNFGFYDKIIYHCTYVDELKKQKYKPRATQIGYSPSSEINIPENYRTCADIFFFLWDPISKSIAAGFPSMKPSGRRADEENQHHGENKTQKEKRISDADVFPPNYTTCIKPFRFAWSVIRFAWSVILSVLGFGFSRIREIQEIKVQHSHAFEIMNIMIKFETSYKYNNPLPSVELEPLGRIEIPDKPLNVDEHEVHQSAETSNGRTSSTKAQSKHDNGEDQNKSGEKTTNVLIKDTPLLVAAKTGIPEMVKKIISMIPVAIHDRDSNGKNVLMLAVEKRQTSVFEYLIRTNLPEYMFYQLDNDGNSILHLAARFGELQTWRALGAFLHMQWEIKWLEHVKRSVPPFSFARRNTKLETPSMVFTETHANLVKEGKEWLIKTSESCLVVAALIATVAFNTSTTVPGGLNQTGRPILKNHTAFDIFVITSSIALCLSVTALIFFIAIITSRCEERDFASNLPRKFFTGLTSLIVSITAMLASFGAGHTFILRERLRPTAVPIYVVATVPLTVFAVAQLSSYFDLLCAALTRVPLQGVLSLG